MADRMRPRPRPRPEPHIDALASHVAILNACLADDRSDKERARGDRAVWAADPAGGTVGTIAGAAAQASYAFDTVLGEGVSNAEVRVRVSVRIERRPGFEGQLDTVLGEGVSNAEERAGSMTGPLIALYVDDDGGRQGVPSR